MNLHQAINIANDFTNIVRPYVMRIDVAGSVRRECEEVRDIDIVCCQHPYKLEQFFMRECKKHGISTKLTDPVLDLKHGSRHKQVLYKGYKIEVFFASPKNYGLILLIRTGSADFSKKMLSAWKRVSKGGYSQNGILKDARHSPVFVPEEEAFFKLCDMNIVPPNERSI